MRKKDIVVLGKGPTQGLDDISKRQKINILLILQKKKKHFCLSVHFNGSNSFFFVNATEIYHFKAKKNLK